MNFKLLTVLAIITIMVVLAARGQTNSAAAPSQPYKSVILTWKYPQSLPSADLQFEIWTQTNVVIPPPVWTNKPGTDPLQKTNWGFFADPLKLSGSNWWHLGNSTLPSVKINNVFENQFFIVRATNSVTKRFSDWSMVTNSVTE